MAEKRQKHPQNPSQISYLSLQSSTHRLCLWIYLTLGWRRGGGALGPHSNGTDKKTWEPPKKKEMRGKNSTKGGSKLELELLSLPQWSHFLFSSPFCAFLISLSPFLSFFPVFFSLPFLVLSGISPCEHRTLSLGWTKAVAADGH